MIEMLLAALLFARPAGADVVEDEIKNLHRLVRTSLLAVPEGHNPKQNADILSAHLVEIRRRLIMLDVFMSVSDARRAALHNVRDRFGAVSQVKCTTTPPAVVDWCVTALRDAAYAFADLEARDSTWHLTAHGRTFFEIGSNLTALLKCRLSGVGLTIEPVEHAINSLDDFLRFNTPGGTRRRLVNLRTPLEDLRRAISTNDGFRAQLALTRVWVDYLGLRRDLNNAEAGCAWALRVPEVRSNRRAKAR